MYLSDLYDKFNVLNKVLQGKNLNLVSPFEANVDKMKVEFQEKFIELVADPELKVKFLRVGFESFWLQPRIRQQQCCHNLFTISSSWLNNAKRKQ